MRLALCWGIATVVSTSGFTGASAPPLALTVFVSPTGSDGAHGGTAAAPFATLTRARDAVRQQRKKKQGAAGPARVELACGRYDLASQGRLELTAEDSNVTWAAAAPEGSAAEAACWPTLSGGVLVDAAAWKPAGSPGLWVASLAGPAAHLIPANTTRLLVDGRPRERVRTGVLHWNRTIESSRGGVNTKCDLAQPFANLSQNCYGFVIDPTDVPDSWATTTAALARWRVAAFHDFTMSYHTVRSYERASGTLLFNEPAEIPCKSSAQPAAAC